MSISCNINNCNETFKEIGLYRNHLIGIYKQNHPCIKQTFKSEDDFLKYKKEFEDNNFVKLRFRTSKKGITWYRCNQSPCFKKESI